MVFEGEQSKTDKLQFIEAGASHDNSPDEGEEEEDLVQELYIFLQGNATLYCPLRGERPWQCGEVIGEAPFAGTTRLYPARVLANSVSTKNMRSSKRWHNRKAVTKNCCIDW
eukprot:symbB.v1.2.014973.t1/scaffold1107.1/size155946/7